MKQWKEFSVACLVEALRSWFDFLYLYWQERETFLFETKVTWSSAFDFLWVILTDILQHMKCFNFVAERWTSRVAIQLNPDCAVCCAKMAHYPRLLESIWAGTSGQNRLQFAPLRAPSLHL